MSSAPIARQEAGNDPYHWLENRDSEEVLAYLQAENAYLETVLEPQQALREQLFEEIKGRIRENDLSLPTPWGDYPTTSAPPPETNIRGTIAAAVLPMVRWISTRPVKPCYSTPTNWPAAAFFP